MNSIELYLWFICSLGKTLHIIDLGICSKFLIIHDRPNHRLCLLLHLYIVELLAEWNMAQCKTASVTFSLFLERSFIIIP